MPINQFTQQLNFILAAMAGAERIFDMMEECEEVDEGRVTPVSYTHLDVYKRQVYVYDDA